MPPGVQGYDRYAYVNNNPVRYTDPTGHSGRSASGCTLSYVECFKKDSLYEFEDYQQVDQTQFEELEVAVYSDLKERDQGMIPLLWWDPAREEYDTPFFNGKNKPDNHVCFGKDCYKQSDVNYFAQGMWGAASGQTLEKTIDLARTWKKLIYGEELSKETTYWITVGYDKYSELDSQSQTKTSRPQQSLQARQRAKVIAL